MRHLFAALGRIGQAAALSLALLVATGVNVGAQQPNSVNPTASAVTEDQLFRQLNPTVAGRITIPDDKAGILIQPAGRDWRSFHQVTQAWIGAIAILGMGAVILTFYFVRGRIPIGAGPTNVKPDCTVASTNRRPPDPSGTFLSVNGTPALNSTSPSSQPSWS